MELNKEFTPQDKIKQESQFGLWSVYSNGDMSYDNGKYNIYAYKIKKEDWIIHLIDKKLDWLNWNEFLPAYFQALKNIGIKYTQERVFY